MTAKKKVTLAINQGYLTMKQMIVDGDIAEAQRFYSDDLTEEEEQGANLALAEYIVSDSDKGVRFVTAILNGSISDNVVMSLGVSGCDLVNITAQMVFELDAKLEQMDAPVSLRIVLLKKVEKALDGFLDESNPDKPLLTVYATCVERLSKLAKEMITNGNCKQYHVWLKKCVRAGDMLVQTDPECVRYRQALSYFLYSLGDTIKGKSALEYYQKSLEHLIKLEELGVDNDGLWHDMSVCYDKLGDSEKSPLQAREHYLKCLELRLRLISRCNDNYKVGMFATPLKKLIALKGKFDVPFYEKLLKIADKASDAGPDDTELQLLVNMIVSELLKMTKYAVNESSCSWQEIEAKSLERVVARDTTEPRYFWLLSDSYLSQAQHYAKALPEKALDLYYKCLDNSEKVIELDRERICYSCGLRPRLQEIDQFVNHHFPDLCSKWCKRWLSIAKSCESLCDQQQVMEHRIDIHELEERLAKVKS